MGRLPGSVCIAAFAGTAMSRRGATGSIAELDASVVRWPAQIHALRAVFDR